MVAKMVEEIGALGSDPAWDPERIRSLFVGGGTPSVLPGALVGRLVAAARGVAPALREVSVEANPESCTREFALALSDAGVHRLSVGVQSLESAAARAIGRRLTTRAELERVRAAWPGRLSFDLIHAAPGSTQRGFLESIDLLLALGAEHLSIYGLSVEEATPLAARVRSGTVTIPEPDAWDEVVAHLADHGLERYEVSNFARAGAECAHNLAYWRGLDYVGLGPSAVSTVTIGSGRVRLTATADHARYLRREGVLDAEREGLSADESRFERLMLGLRTREGVPWELLRETADESVALGLIADGLLMRTEGRVAPTNRGMDLLDRVLVALL